MSCVYVGLSKSVAGSIFLASKWGCCLEHGDLVAVKGGASVRGRILIKYIAGLPGDNVLVREPYVYINHLCLKVQSGVSGIKGGRIPQGKCFVWGTSKDSLDSRYRAVGLLNIADVQGVVRCVII